MLGRTDSRIRLVALLVGLAFFASLICVRLTYWQLGQAGELNRLAAAQLRRADGLEAARGDIVDRRGTLLATTAYRDLLAAHPDLISADRRADVARKLGRILGLGGRDTEQLVDSFERAVPYVVVARRLTTDQSRRIRDGLESGDLAALSLEPRPMRVYPNSGGSPGTTLASQLLGFVTDDGEGRYGVEQYSQQLLASESAATAALGDGLGGPPSSAQAGGRLQLTIDASLQLRVEKELYAAWIANRAKRVSAVVMDPYTGAVLAQASVPGYDANDYAAVAGSSPWMFVDPNASDVYEPGSVMKMFTAAAAFESGVVTPRTVLRDDKRLEVGRNTVRNFDLRGMGKITFEDAIAFSRNVVTGKVAQMLGPTTDAAAAVLYETWQRLGIGRPTGVELSNESKGLVADPELSPWAPIDLVNRAFGQGVAVTTLQLASAYSAMVNGGELLPAHVVVDPEQPGGLVDGEQVLDPELSRQLRQLMVHVVDTGPHYAAETRIAGYTVGGKTGTAQIWDTKAHAWKSDIYNHTFCGFIGTDEPELVIVVRIHDSRLRVMTDWGMALEFSSNELFRRIAQEAIAVLDIPPAGGGPTLDDPDPLPTDLPPPTASPQPATTSPPASPTPIDAGEPATGEAPRAPWR
jgi:cell division protein FtsI/penicillin-binding protein 2